MKIRFCHIALISFTLTCCLHAHAQEVEGLDSLEDKILESVQKGLSKKGHPENFLDSGDFFNGKMPIDLKSIFKEVDKGISMAKSMGDVNKIRGGYYKLSALDSMRGNYKGAYENYKLYSLYRDSLQKKETERKRLEAKMQYEFDKKQAIAKAEQEKRDADARRVKNLQYFAIAGLLLLVVVVLLIALIQWRNNRQRKQANTVLKEQKEKVESTLSELKLTQASLIHSEKMASLGELTAGIAHEIKNPLNFVNNFSEVNSELIHEISTGNDIQEIRIIANDIRQNNEKILFHGRRADDIVKGMLQHSSPSSGVKELTDLNALCDEYLRISYHGFVAKETDFTATLKTDFDPQVGKVSINAGDIGRVLSNLYSNAFYAVSEKNKFSSANNPEGKYEPAVSVSTKKLADRIEIRVNDNGNGIPSNIVDKIFQPFFTTKPAGQGTGLGLSLAYDIVRANGGQITVNSNANEGTGFTIAL